MSDIGAVTIALAAGMALGAIFFGGLRWTVRRGVHAANPGLWFGVSALLRMAIAVSGFYFVARLGWPSLIACLCGLLTARAGVIHLTRTAG